MDFYVIPPRARIGMSSLGDRDFCLCQQYMKDPDYREYFRECVRQGRWVTLDNGAGDHDIITMRDLIKVMIDLHPSEVIPPDYLFDGVRTIYMLEAFIQDDNRSCMGGRKIEIFGCPQGSTKSDWLFTYKYMLEHPEVNTIGFSKIAVPFAFLNALNDTLIKEARHMAYDYLKAKDLIKKPIHLLGMGDPTEVLYYKDPLIRSVDSCNTIWSAMNGIDFTLEHTRIKTPKDYFERDLTSNEIQLAKKNISWFRDQVNSLVK